MVPIVNEKLLIFSKASGLTFNLKKCVLYVVNNSAWKEIENKYLGVVIMKNVNNRKNLNFIPRLEKVSKSLNLRLIRDLSITDRVLLTKTEVYTSPKN